MTTPDDENRPANGDGRAVRPTLARTQPKRSIVNAFYQPEAKAPSAPPNGPRFEDEDVWGAAQPHAGEKEEKNSPKPKSQGLWNDPFDAVRAAYGVVNEQIKAGYEEAAKLNTDGIAPSGRNISRILNRLVQTYSDLGTQWVDLIMATAESREKADQNTRPAPAGDLSIAVEVTTARPAKARALLYRAPSGSLSVWPLRRDGGGAEITDVGVAPGPSVTLQIDADAEPGLYRGIIVEEGAEEPAGSIILNILEPDG